jgi:hypothetical protein
MKTIGDNVYELAERCGFSRVRVNGAVVRGDRQWRQLARQLDALDAGARGPETNPCVIIRRGSSVAEPRRDTFIAPQSGAGRSFRDYPAAVPAPAQRAAVEDAIDDARVVLDLPRLRIRFVSRPSHECTLGVAAIVPDDAPEQTVLIALAVNGLSTEQLRVTALHELKHSADLKAGLHLLVSREELERRADAFEDQMREMRFARLLRRA